MGSIELKKGKKWFNEVNVIKSIDLKIYDGEFLVLVGPSGCGKSTLLRMIGGLEDTTMGDIVIDGQVVTNFPPSKRGLSMVFQSYAHLDCRCVVGMGKDTGRNEWVQLN